MPTKHYGWMTLTPGQIEVSSGYNAFVNELDELMYSVLKVIKDGFREFVHGLEVTLIGTVLQVGAGWAILRDGSIFVKDDATQVQGGNGYVVIDSTTKTITLKSTPNYETDTLLAYVDGSTVYDLRFPTPDYIQVPYPPLGFEVVSGSVQARGLVAEVTVSSDNPFKAQAPLTIDGDPIKFSVPFALRMGLPVLPPDPSPLTIYIGVGTNVPPASPDLFVGLRWANNTWSYISSIYGTLNQQDLPEGTKAIKVVVRGGRSEWMIKVNDRWEKVTPLTAPLTDVEAKILISVQSTSSALLTVQLPSFIIVFGK